MKKSNKKTIALSVVTMLMSGALIAGATYAWFSTSVKNRVKIRSGEMQIQLHKWDGAKYNDISNDEAPVFDTGDAWWEPGFTTYAALKVVNMGTLALQYDVVVDCKLEGDELAMAQKLAEVIDVYYLEGTYESIPETRGELFESFECVGTLSDLMAMGTDGVAHGDLLGRTGTEKEGEADYVIIALHMQETADNEYQKLDAEYDVTIYAGQNTVESDDFDDEYDKDAKGAVRNVEGIVKSSVSVAFKDREQKVL